MNRHSASLVLFLLASSALAACSGAGSDNPAVPTAATNTSDKGGTSVAAATVTITGTISSLSGTCPTVSFALEGKTIRINASTAFGDLKCAGLANGVRVTVAGTTQTDGSILAIKLAPAAVTTTVTATVSLTGTISALGGTCPAVSFTVENKKIVINAATAFGDTKCTDLKNGDKASVTGTIQADASILALKVAVSAPISTSATLVTVTGTVSALEGTCPTVRFTVEGKRIATNATTTFGDAKCTDLTNGSKGSATGTVQADGSILALKVGITP